ncbi:MAG: hypothetical protein AVDCRST_MAG87-2374, partial [uncultured Thermomicrobiales bacterium]
CPTICCIGSTSSGPPGTASPGSGRSSSTRSAPPGSTRRSTTSTGEHATGIAPSIARPSTGRCISLSRWGWWSRQKRAGKPSTRSARCSRITIWCAVPAARSGRSATRASRPWRRRSTGTIVSASRPITSCCSGAANTARMQESGRVIA